MQFSSRAIRKKKHRVDMANRWANPIIDPEIENRGYNWTKRNEEYKREHLFDYQPTNAAPLWSSRNVRRNVNSNLRQSANPWIPSEAPMETPSGAPMGTPSGAPLAAPHYNGREPCRYHAARCCRYGPNGKGCAFSHAPLPNSGTRRSRKSKRTQRRSTRKNK